MPAAPPVATQPTSTAGATPHTSTTMTSPPPRPPDDGGVKGDMASVKSGLDSLADPNPKPTGVHDTPGRRQQAARATRDRPPEKPPAEETPKQESPKDEAPAEDDPMSELNELMGKPKAQPKSTPKQDQPAQDDPQLEQEFTKGPAALREAYQKLKDEVKNQRSTFEKEMAAYKKESEERKQLSEQLSKLQAERDEYENKLRYLDFEQSREYAEKYKAPLEHSYDIAQKEVAQLYVQTPEGSQRAATADDFDSIVRLNTGDAIAKARELFGDAASEVLGHRRKVLETAEAARKARDDYKTKGAEQRKAEEANSKIRSDKLQSLWTQANTELSSKFPKFFAPDDTDAEGNQLLDEGTKLADLAFSNMENMDDNQRLYVHSQIRNRAAAFPRMAQRWLKSQQEIKSLKAKLAAYENSAPGRGEGRSTNGDSPSSDYHSNTLADVLSGLDRIAR